MNEKPSLAFAEKDAGRALLLSQRLHRLSKRIDELTAGHINARTTRALQTVARTLHSTADELHPTLPRFGTLTSRRGLKVAVIDSRTRTNYRLLPCRQAGVHGLTKPDMVSTYRVVEWPTLALALEYVRAANKINDKIRSNDKAHLRRNEPLRRLGNRLFDRLRKKATAHQQREMQKHLAIGTAKAVVP